jgi:hypothetical protein
MIDVYAKVVKLPGHYEAYEEIYWGREVPYDVDCRLRDLREAT